MSKKQSSFSHSSVDQKFDIKASTKLCSFPRWERFYLLSRPTSGSCKHPWTCGCLTPVPASISHSLPFSEFFLCVSLIRTLFIRFRIYPENPEWSHLQILKLITSTRSFFQRHLHRVCGLYKHISLGATIQPTTSGNLTGLPVSINSLAELVLECSNWTDPQTQEMGSRLGGSASELAEGSWAITWWNKEDKPSEGNVKGKQRHRHSYFVTEQHIWFDVQNGSDILFELLGEQGEFPARLSKFLGLISFRHWKKSPCKIKKCYWLLSKIISVNGWFLLFGTVLSVLWARDWAS